MNELNESNECNFIDVRNAVGDIYDIILQSLEKDINKKIVEIRQAAREFELYDIGHHLKGAGLQTNLTPLTNLGKNLETYKDDQLIDPVIQNKFVEQLTSIVSEIKHEIKVKEQRPKMYHREKTRQHKYARYKDTQ